MANMNVVWLGIVPRKELRRILPFCPKDTSLLGGDTSPMGVIFRDSHPLTFIEAQIIHMEEEGPYFSMALLLEKRSSLAFEVLEVHLRVDTIVVEAREKIAESASLTAEFDFRFQEHQFTARGAPHDRSRVVGQKRIPSLFTISAKNTCELASSMAQMRDLYSR